MKARSLLVLAFASLSFIPTAAAKDKAAGKGADSKPLKGESALIGGDFRDVDTNKDGKIAKAELVAFLEGALKEFDLDKNGNANRKEAIQAKGKRKAEKKAAQFAKKDENKDGFLSESEAKLSAKKFKKLDSNKDGRLSRSEACPAEKVDGPGKKFEFMDLNHDGAVSTAEAKEAAETALKKADKNKDGAITAEELRPLLPKKK